MGSEGGYYSMPSHFGSMAAYQGGYVRPAYPMFEAMGGYVGQTPAQRPSPNQGIDPTSSAGLPGL